ncbi:hypothetical protein KKG29_02135 [Patescibacteria group bacterium]|nr:hypothetical protein [Patescibacteria group bacterium]MBU3999956.1 hypothetical protein [Patescibacteria group bacterium]MBU4056972.1 hypothetical protein [Patescibacteria group bacterium]MBU4368623.1 hypothetical protein [Patescibacteria group bacterium]
MDFTPNVWKALNGILKEIGIAGIINEVKISILFCFIDYPGPDPKQLCFSRRTSGQISKSVNDTLVVKHNRQIMPIMAKLITFGFVREVGGEYELTRVGEVVARNLYDMNSIASEDHATRKRN